MKLRLFLLLTLVSGTAVLLAGCSLPQRVRPTPTLNLTEVYGTLTVMMTTQPALTPSAAPSDSAIPTQPTDQTVPPSATIGLILTPSAVLPTFSGSCDQAAAGMPIDVTIPDNTIIEPGLLFTKIWRLENVGSCTWTTNYSAAFFYGDRMDAPATVPFDHAVPPGGAVEIAVEMVAPLTPGDYQGNWKLSNAQGVLFGIGPNGDAPFWVRIIVSESQPGTQTITPTQSPEPTMMPTPSLTPTPTPTATPPVQASGTISMAPADLIDLDTLTLNTPGADLAYQTDANNYHYLIPQEVALLGVYGSLEPGLEACQAASMSSAPIAVESLSIGTYLCYQTNLGAVGRGLLSALDPVTFNLTLDLVTWALP
jgi:hypothetical protein